MLDLRLRALERARRASHDPLDDAAYLTHRLRAGTLTHGRLRQAATWGHPGARLALGLPELAPLAAIRAHPDFQGRGLQVSATWHEGAAILAVATLRTIGAHTMSPRATIACQALIHARCVIDRVVYGVGPGLSRYYDLFQGAESFRPFLFDPTARDRFAWLVADTLRGVFPAYPELLWEVLAELCLLWPEATAIGVHAVHDRHLHAPRTSL